MENVKPAFQDTINLTTEKEEDTSLKDRNSGHTITRAVTILDITQNYDDIFKYLSLNDLLSLSYTCTHLNAEIESRKIKEILFCRNIDPNEKLSSLTQECYYTSIKKWLEGFKNNTVSYLSELTSHPSFTKILFYNITKTLQRCEAFSLKTIATIPNESYFVHFLFLNNPSCFSLDGRYFASINAKNIIIMKRTASQQWKREDEVNILSYASHVKFIPGEQNNILAVTNHKGNYSLNILEKKNTEGNWEITHTFKHDDEIVKADYSADGRFIASASRDCTTQVIGRIQDPNPQRIASTQDRATEQAQSWHINKTMIKKDVAYLHKWVNVITIKHDGSGMCASFSAGVKQQFITASHIDDKVKIWETDNNRKWKEACILEKGTNHSFDGITSCAFNRNGLYLYIKGFINAPNHNFRTIEILRKSNDGIWMIEATVAHEQYISNHAFSPNGKNFLTISTDHTVKVWGINSSNFWIEMYTFQYQYQLETACVHHTFTFSPHSRRAAIILVDKLIILRLERSRVTEERNMLLSDTMLRTDGSVEDNPGIFASRGAEVDSRSPFTQTEYKVAFCADENHLAIAGNYRVNILGFNCVNRVWASKVTHSLSDLAKVLMISFSPDGSILAVTKTTNEVGPSTETEMLAISDKEASINTD